jgi:hypothetical protein
LLIQAIAFGGALFSSAGITYGQSAGAGTSTAAAQQALINKYCVACHNDKLTSGGLSLAKLEKTLVPGGISDGAEDWEKVILKLRSGMMPPPGLPRPDAATVKSFVTSLETGIDRAWAAHPNPGRPALHRLNRTEYANSVRDLVNLDVDATTLLPADDMSHGFDNMAEVLNISPSLMESYITAAGKISRLAVGDPKMKPVVETYHRPNTFSQVRHVDGTPFGTRGGIAVVHNFPADGEYIIKTTLVFTTNTFLFGSTSHGEQLEVAINGERVALLDVSPNMKVDQDLRTPPIKVKAGPQLVSTSFIKKTEGPFDSFVQPLERALGDSASGSVPGLVSLPHVRDMGINGPYNPTGVSNTPSRQKIFTCHPSVEREELPCARKILTALARRAYRKPVTDVEVEELLSAYQKGRNRGDFESGVRLGLQTILAHPEFVFRFEPTPANIALGTNYRINDLELASRLSYFLWSSAPDEELLALAAQGKLHEPLTLEKQVKRMLADQKSKSLAENFAGEWLYLRNLKTLLPDVYLYPDSDDNLFQSMKRETELFFESFVREDRNIVEMLTANYTFVDERLAKHYGIPNVVGNEFRRVTLTDENRFGLLGQGSILSVTSYANRTSPVVRGKWVMEQILGVTAPPPPPNVPALTENTENAKPKTVRERLEMHRAHEPCASCHKLMDPIGFALENFDAVGAWRTNDLGSKIEASGQLYDGTKVDGPVSLRNALVARSDLFVRSFTVRLLTYALGRGVEYYDMPTVRSIEQESAKNNYRLSSLVLGVVKSVPFQMSRAEAVVAENDKTAAPPTVVREAASRTVAGRTPVKSIEGQR